jgi:regulator of protease activity HflC (stomatin/prohibitin superfamily)
MSNQPNPPDRQTSFGHVMHRLLYHERLRAWGRLALLIVAVIIVSVLGAVIVQLIPPGSSSLKVDACTYDALLLSPPPQAAAPPGGTVTAEWFIKNIGDCEWNDQVLFGRARGDELAVQNETTPVTSLQPGGNPVSPGHDFQPVISMTAPSRAGVYQTTWRLYAPDRNWFGPPFSFTVEVIAGAESPTRIIARPMVDVWFIVPALIGIILAIARSGQFVAALYSLHSIGHGIEFAISTAFGFLAKSITASHGLIEEAQHGSTPPPPTSQRGRSSRSPQPPANPHEALLNIGGPGTLLIKAGTAVLTERGSGYARMLGPGEYTLMPFERVRAVFDLRVQSHSSGESALTKDGIPVEATVNTMFHFMKPLPNEPTPPPPPPGFGELLRRWLGRPPRTPPAELLPASPEALRIAAYEIPANPNFRLTWSYGAHNGVAGGVREELASRLLDQLFAPDDRDSRPRQDISDTLFEHGKAALARRGIELLSSGFGNITVPPEVIEQRRRTWQMIWEKESIITKSGGEADGLLQTRLVQAEAQAELIQSVTQAIRTMGQTLEPGDTTHPLSLKFMDVMARVLERSLREASFDAIDQRDIDRILDRLRRALIPGAGKSG